MTRTIQIIITDTPANTKAIAKDMRHALDSLHAFIYDNCGCGSKEQPRRIVAEMAERKDK